MGLINLLESGAAASTRNELCNKVKADPCLLLAPLAEEKAHRGTELASTSSAAYSTPFAGRDSSAASQ